MPGVFRHGLFAKAVSAEEQLQIFRLRFTPLKMTTVFVSGSECTYFAKVVSAEEQPQIFRLRFTALKMTTAFCFWARVGVSQKRVIICTFPQKYLF
jgi:hypothetical protein